MAPPLLFLRHRGVTPRVERYFNAQPTAVGNVFGTDDGAGSPQYWTRRNAVIHVGGSLYAVTYDGVYKLQPDGVTWSNAAIDGGFPYSNPDLVGGGARARGGLYVVPIGVTPSLVNWYKTTTSAAHLRGLTLNLNTGTWSEQADVNTGDDLGSTDGGSPHSEISFQNLIFFGTAEDSPGVVHQRSYNPQTGAFSSYAHPISNVAGLNYVADYCVMDNLLFMLTPIDVGSGVTGRPQIYQFNGTHWNTAVATLDTVSANLGATNGGVCRWCLFTDGTNLYAFCLVNTSGGNYGWRAYRITSGFVVTDITTAVLPTSLRSTDDGGTGVVQTARFTKMIDSDTVPATPAFYLWHTTNNSVGVARDLYQWVDDATPMTLVDTGGDAADAAPALAQAGGERIWTNGEMDILITNRLPVLGGERIFFKAWGSVGLADKIVRFYFNKFGEPIAQQMTLTGTATGGTAIRVGSQVNNVEADDGATEYSVIWDIGADLVNTGDRVQVNPRISTT